MAILDALINSENRFCQKQNPEKSTPGFPPSQEWRFLQHFLSAPTGYGLQETYMPITLKHKDALVIIEEIDSMSRHVRVDMCDSSVFSPRTQWVTRYPVALIEAVLSHRGPA